MGITCIHRFSLANKGTLRAAPFRNGLGFRFEMTIPERLAFAEFILFLSQKVQLD